MNEQNRDTQETEISLFDLYVIIRKNIVLILAFVTLFAMIAGGYAFFIVNETFKSTADVMVEVQVDSTTDVNYDYSTAQKLLDTISEFMAKDIVLEQVISDLELDYTTTQLRSGLSITSSTTSFFINIEYVDEDPELAGDIVNSVIDNATEIANNNAAFSTLKDKIARTSYAVDGTYHAPNKVLYVIIGILLGGITGVGIVFIKELMNNSYKTKEQLEQAFGIQVLGVIPHIDVKEEF